MLELEETLVLASDRRPWGHGKRLRRMGLPLPVEPQPRTSGKIAGRKTVAYGWLSFVRLVSPPMAFCSVWLIGLIPRIV